MSLQSSSPSDQYRRGEQASSLRNADRLNQPLREVAALRQHVFRNLAAAEEQELPGRYYLAKITLQPTGKTDYTDERYWVTVARPKLTLSSTDVLDTDPDLTIEQGVRVVTATHLGERTAHTHSLTDGQLIVVFEDVTDGSAPMPVRYFLPIGSAPNVKFVA